MRKILTIVLIAGFLLTIASGVTARQGDSEATILGNYMAVNLSGKAQRQTEDLFGIGASIGYFTSDQVRLGGQFLSSFSGDTSLYAIGANLKYHFMTENSVVPYIGGQINYAFFDTGGSDADGITYAPLAGLRFSFDQRKKIFLEYQFQRNDIDIGNIRKFIDDADVLLLGIACKF
jgi:hypothetical protein